MITANFTLEIEELSPQTVTPIDQPTSFSSKQTSASVRKK